MPSPSVAPQKPNNTVWWILGIFGGVLVLFVLAGLTAAGLIIRHIDVRSNNNRVEIQTPVGEIKVSKDATHATGLPVYPQARKGTDDNMVGGSADISLGNRGLGIAAEAYQSADSLEAVKTWYRSRLGPSFRLEAGKGEHERLGRAHFDLSNQDWAFVDDRDDTTSLVALRRIDNRVQITLLLVGTREAQ
jgi:hypothetical protein